MAERLHFLDWIRTILIVFVVYAHLSFSGLRLEMRHSIVVDNNAYASGPEQRGNAVRYNALARQMLIPSLFWVSGAAEGCSFKDSVPKMSNALLKLAFITVVGMSLNIAVWALGPKNGDCLISEPCPGKGLLFDFTDVPQQSLFFQFLNQMWFVVMLMCVLVWLFPLRRAMVRKSSAHFIAQWCCSVVIFAIMVNIYSRSPSWQGVNGVGLLASLAGFEAVFLAAAFSIATGSCESMSVPTRAMQYVCGFAALGQVSVSPMVGDHMPGFGEGINMGVIIYLYCLASKSFQLGFIFVTSRASAGRLLSHGWPAVCFLMFFFMPSTNWTTMGVLAYPYFGAITERCAYYGGCLIFFFFIDGYSRVMPCFELPGFIGNGGLLLYVVHPFVMTCLIQFCTHNLYAIWLGTTSICFAAAWLLSLRRSSGGEKADYAKVLKESNSEPV